MKILGVDPGGASGALAIIEQTNGAPTAVVSVIDVPLVGSGARQRVDAIALQEWLPSTSWTLHSSSAVRLCRNKALHRVSNMDGWLAH